MCLLRSSKETWEDYKTGLFFTAEMLELTPDNHAAAILHISSFSIAAAIIPLTSLHTKLELVIGPEDREGMASISN